MTHDLADGGWHRLHPATPLLRGGIVLIAILGFVVANFRERLIDWLFGAPELPGDPLQTAYERGQLGWAALVVAGLLLLGIASFFLSWRLHTFRIGDDVVEVRSGVLFRTHRRARIDRIQGVAIDRPFFARLFGTARVDISVAGQDAKVQLAYLGGADADALRGEVLRLASGARAAEAQVDTAHPSPPGEREGIVNQRVRELLAPELDPSLAAPESVVKIPPGRLIGSLVLSGFTVMVVLAVALLLTTSMLGRREFLAFIVLPGLVAAIGYYVNRFTKTLRYSIAGTPDGIRVGSGLLSTNNDTLPPGRVHAIEVSQPLLWRPAGWWMIRINRAGAAGEATAQASTTMLPVGTIDDARRVLELLVPGMAGSETGRLVDAGLTARRGEGFTDAPRRARLLRPFSWRRTGFARGEAALLLRGGFVWRRLVVVPLARVQSIRVSQGPVRRGLGLAELTVHTVAGPVRPELAVVDREVAREQFEEWSAAVVIAIDSDRSHRWAERPDDERGRSDET
ncbi:PH domain-containing protein [Herbiconiux moechotypicola]|uniref:PH domain-containing protein n=1 Tax=Herbiconiux moechotypicola TaxID=637393 RepID=A0ABN3E3M7_9MICO|nr:PH domain-containing protein [Herbiconiux moechotypicola]MCS5731612.1 PH domain-containing protein [Herbiconiux moechotypicola]